MQQKESLVAKTAGVVKTVKAALSAKQLRTQAEQSIAEDALLRAANNKKRSGSAQALLSLAGLIPKESGLPVDLLKRHNEYTWGD
jgi:hypothetical protein